MLWCILLYTVKCKHPCILPRNSQYIISEYCRMQTMTLRNKMGKSAQNTRKRKRKSYEWESWSSTWLRLLCFCVCVFDAFILFILFVCVFIYFFLLSFRFFFYSYRYSTCLLLFVGLIYFMLFARTENYVCIMLWIYV